ncbi:(+)-trans-carveol dehydrogenase/(-)-trans-carveol dehydrogenase [Williamsia limnetica]|uniref:(+)-trans-carveol dehydrogenase/(-)-trans-carveol dehydrogenase n=1 Tax=Williamsia limnetica TaxID=882452 RepID=A0A318RBF7_WILLI|nr:mycofactocin-coupled SDR family oxidoreductase [Williamsia limnetica]PYE12427.1 (+)-trans-carveol dehydrogenase/(-)-trans-carveol dehydrogenase [Williamsia limnetica]
MNRLQNKVALITGAARGQGRAHAIRLAEEGADIIAVDIPREVIDIGYPMGTEAELADTAAAVEALDRRIITAAVDVRDIDALTAAVTSSVAELGRLDIISANAGIAASPHAGHEIPEDAWQQMLDINLTGVWHTVKAGVPHMLAAGNGGSIILTSSAAGLKGYASIAHYVAAKHGVVGLMRSLTQELGPQGIRVNSIHPTQVDTPMIQNESTYRIFRPDLEKPTREDFEPASATTNILPIPWVEPVDVSNAVLFLASDEARYITGATLPVDAGCVVK